MSIRDDVQAAMKDAMRAKDRERLECLRLAKAALLLKEKEGPAEGPISDEDAVAALRAEVKKRQQSVETYRGYGRQEEVEKLEREIATLESFLPAQLDEEMLEQRVRAYLAAHPDIDHAGRLTGALKKELGDKADGRMLNQVCQRVLDETK